MKGKEDVSVSQLMLNVSHPTWVSVSVTSKYS